jgi:hypothetical protein
LLATIGDAVGEREVYTGKIEYAMFPITYPLLLIASAIALGAVYSHATSFIVSQPIFGAAFRKAREASNKEDFLKSEEATNAGIAYGTSLVSAGFQSYAVAALLKLTGTVTYAGASTIGVLLFTVTQGPSIVASLVIQKRSLDVIAAQTVSALLDTVGLAVFLTWWDEPTLVLP